jgi:hypothetical protein
MQVHSIINDFFMFSNILFSNSDECIQMKYDITWSLCLLFHQCAHADIFKVKVYIFYVKYLIEKFTKSRIEIWKMSCFIWIASGSILVYWFSSIFVHLFYLFFMDFKLISYSLCAVCLLLYLSTDFCTFSLDFLFFFLNSNIMQNFTVVVVACNIFQLYFPLYLYFSFASYFCITIFQHCCIYCTFSCYVLCLVSSCFFYFTKIW